VLGDHTPALVVDAAIAELLEVLHVVPFGFVGFVPSTDHAMIVLIPPNRIVTLARESPLARVFVTA
jgi:hypothetical protein